ncbi:PEP-CTERM/exosortase system-associated acyltransferase [Halomonas korlensis]|uniref:N-acyl amino acid synthase, PEP-CTERM/exosortase system-associated n=1 Tax=Halomonas korlensis TaxID=463301 RepID=A0A1I7I9N7_9GAMM|nr:PEP-CTERM/exosortase system-associated acyltransferase [Halomonas korlensis]SFU69647.1 N-acyl amino acid synthase, PEP-CTERM/exosortase system-associated [Halomonas korlensis]
MASCLAARDAQPSTSNKLARFMQEFRFHLAVSKQQKQRIYRLRYEIYCEELAYEDPADRACRLEYDLYDQNALHCLIEHRRTGLAAACTRLVMPEPGSPDPFDRLPMESYGGRSLTHPSLHPAKLPTESYYEISRLAIARAFRPRIKGSEVPGVTDNPHDFSHEERATFSLLVSGLFLAGYALGCMSNKELAFAMMDPRLPRLLSIAGFHFTKVGDTIDFHGQRSAYCIGREQAQAGMRKELQPLFSYIHNELEPQFEALLTQEAIDTPA